jgi:predicted Zn-dependent protease
MRRTRAALFAALALAVAPTTAPADWPPKPAPGYNIFSDEQEVWLGEVFVEEFNLDARVLDDQEATSYLQALGERLAAASKRPKLPYRFMLYGSDDVDAFALPGGRIYVTRGLVRFCRTEGELAGILGHEIAHVALRQAAKTHSRWLFWALGVTKVGDKEDIRAQHRRLMVEFRGTEHAQQALDIFFGIARTDELLADKYGIWNAYAAGFDPQETIRVFERMPPTAAEREGNPFLILVSTHPPTADRTAFHKMEAFWMKKKEDAVVDTSAFHGFQARVEEWRPRAAAVAPP